MRWLTKGGRIGAIVGTVVVLMLANVGLCAAAFGEAELAANKARSAVRAGAGLFERLIERWRREPYALDEHSRIPSRTLAGRLDCPDVELEAYAGDTVAWRPAVRVNPHFRERMARLERVAARVGREVYGRAPERILHLGVYNCRTIRSSSWRLSEHAFGNAVDVTGFAFGAAEDGDGRPDAFTVDIETHWGARRGAARKHAVFLHGVAEALERCRVFRGMLIPPSGGHHDHFHLDMATWRFVNAHTEVGGAVADEVSCPE